jgi:hypothetical protein
VPLFIEYESVAKRTGLVSGLSRILPQPKQRNPLPVLV